MKILLIIPYRGIGDLIFHIPLIRGLYKKYNSKINILTNEVNKAKNLLRYEKTVKEIFYANFQRENQLVNSYNFNNKKYYHTVKKNKLCDTTNFTLQNEWNIINYD